MDGLNNEPMKRKPLKFKATKEKKLISSDNCTPKRMFKSSVSESRENREEHTKEEEDKQEQSSKQFEEFEEWGPSINGYRFVAAKSDQNRQFTKKHRLITEDYHKEASYSWSYLPLPTFNQIEEDKFDREKHSEFVYDDYIRAWERIRQEGLRELVFPLFDQDDEVSLHNIKKFFRTKKDVQLLEISRMERVRWHPDKMIQTLRLEKDERELITKITTVFQFVNQIYEQCK